MPLAGCRGGFSQVCNPIPTRRGGGQIMLTVLLLKPLQNKKGKKIWGTREKSSPFIRKKTSFFSGTPNFFGPSYFEGALPDCKQDGKKI